MLPSIFVSFLNDRTVLRGEQGLNTTDGVGVLILRLPALTDDLRTTVLENPMDGGAPFFLGSLLIHSETERPVHHDGIEGLCSQVVLNLSTGARCGSSARGVPGNWIFYRD